MTAARCYRVLVCGTRFGEHYLAALRSAGERFQLAGILASGSPRSRALATALKVPLFHSVDELPEGAIDLACVVIRSSIVGGSGTAIAQQLLERKVHVLQEHPVDPRDLASLTDCARRMGVRYHLNTLYPHLSAPRAFIDYVARWREARRRTSALPAYVELTTSVQLLYSTLDISFRALGEHAGFVVSAPAPLDEAVAAALRGARPPFKALHGVIGGLPFRLNLQSYLDMNDPDHHSLVMHRVAIGGSEGSATLLNSFGPVTWTHSIYAPSYQRNDEHASFLLHPEVQAESRFLTQPTACELHPGGAPLAELARGEIPDAILRALNEQADSIESGVAAAWQSEAAIVALGRAWLSTMQRAGMPENRQLREPPAPTPDPKAFAEEQRRRGAEATL